MFLRSSGEQRAMELREAHREKVACNELRVSPLWAQPCRAYNVHVELDPRTRSSLQNIQQSLYQAEPNLLVCPEKTLHVSLAWLVAVHASYKVDKDSLWKRHKEQWMAQLRRITAQSKGFRITTNTLWPPTAHSDRSRRADRAGEPHPHNDPRAPSVAIRDPQRG